MMLTCNAFIRATLSWASPTPRGKKKTPREHARADPSVAGAVGDLVFVTIGMWLERYLLWSRACTVTSVTSSWGMYHDRGGGGDTSGIMLYYCTLQTGSDLDVAVHPASYPVSLSREMQELVRTSAAIRSGNRIVERRAVATRGCLVERRAPSGNLHTSMDGVSEFRAA